MIYENKVKQPSSALFEIMTKKMHYKRAFESCKNIYSIGTYN